MASVRARDDLAGNNDVEVCMGIPCILREVHGNWDRCCGYTMEMEMGAAGIRQTDMLIAILRCRTAG